MQGGGLELLGRVYIPVAPLHPHRQMTLGRAISSVDPSGEPSMGVCLYSRLKPPGLVRRFVHSFPAPRVHS